MTQIRGTSAAACDLSGSFGFAEKQLRYDILGNRMATRSEAAPIKICGT
jgi:hypothetical protein